MRTFILLPLFLFASLYGVTQPEAIIKKFNAYQSAWQKSRLHLISNQDKFSPGDTIFLKAFFLDESWKGIKGIQLIDLDLVNPLGESKSHIMIKLVDGVGHNQFPIPSKFDPGIYYLTAYSSWKRNVDPSAIFRKEIRIVKYNTVVSTELPITKATLEGGHLIRDVANKISLRTHKPASFVQIVDDSGSVRGETTTDGQGMGSILFTPASGATYFARTEGVAIQTPLPDTEDDGCSLLFSLAGNGKPVRLTVSAPQSSKFRSEELVLILSGKGRMVHSTTLRIGLEGHKEVEVPESLTEGLVQVSLLRLDGTLLASRDFYNREKEPIAVRITPVGGPFQPGEKVNLEVSLSGPGADVGGEFVISVTNASLFGEKRENSLFDELCLRSQFGGYFVDRSQENWESGLDNFMSLTTEEIPWMDIMSNEPSRPGILFKMTIQKRGVAYFSDNREPVPVGTVILFYLQRNMMRYQMVVSERGKVMLTIPDIYSDDEFFYIAETEQGEEIHNLSIDWEKEPVSLPASPGAAELQVPDAYATYVAKTSLISNSYNSYLHGPATDGRGKSLTGPTNFEDEIAEADITVRVQDYVACSTTEELVREVIPALRHRIKHGRSTVMVSLPEPMKNPTTDPLYIIDGFATRNSTFFLSLSPADIVEIKIVNNPKKLLPLGLLGENGIVIVETRKGNMRETVNDPSRFIEGLSRPMKFSEVSHSVSTRRHLPDFRSTVYWNPNIRTGAGGTALVSFYSSDDVGKLRIRIDGFANGGKPFSAESEIEVKSAHATGNR